MHETRTHFGSVRQIRFRAPGLLVQIVAILIFLAIVATLFFIVVPLAIILFFVGLIAYAVFRVRLAYQRAHEPNGPLDGRRNVRVIERDEL